mmetsp:Transcript_16329/g.32692  ORF Transcript_16329/g.32692 Transcript_16329/m.32692 type:complete len:207 (+) Transcript_16329:156-776(+)
MTRRCTPRQSDAGHSSRLLATCALGGSSSTTAPTSLPPPSSRCGTTREGGTSSTLSPLTCGKPSGTPSTTAQQRNRPETDGVPPAQGTLRLWLEHFRSGRMRHQHRTRRSKMTAGRQRGSVRAPPLIGQACGRCRTRGMTTTTKEATAQGGYQCLNWGTLQTKRLLFGGPRGRRDCCLLLRERETQSGSSPVTFQPQESLKWVLRT